MKLFIFDVSNIFYRAFWGSDKLSTSHGFPTQGLHGFVRMIQSILRDHRPDLVAFAMEGGGDSPRKQIEPLYKANRSEIPQDLKLQLESLPDLMHVMGYPTFKFAGFEADDTIATLVKKALEQGLEPVIVSSDKDFMQLLTPPVKMLHVAKNEMMGHQEVFAKYGIMPEQFIDYLAIVGDTSDNIKGVKGIGEKGAQKLISQWGSLDNVYLNINSNTESTVKKLVASKDDVYKAKQLIGFLEVPMVADLRTVCNWAGPRRAEARELFRRWEFRDLEQMVLGATEVVSVGGVEIGVRR